LIEKEIVRVGWIEVFDEEFRQKDVTDFIAFAVDFELIALPVLVFEVGEFVNPNPGVEQEI